MMKALNIFAIAGLLLLGATIGCFGQIGGRSTVLLPLTTAIYVGSTDSFVGVSVTTTHQVVVTDLTPFAVYNVQAFLATAVAGTTASVQPWILGLRTDADGNVVSNIVTRTSSNDVYVQDGSIYHDAFGQTYIFFAGGAPISQTGYAHISFTVYGEG